MKPASALLVVAVTLAAAAASCSDGEDQSARTAAAREASAQCLSDVGGLYQQKIAPLLATDHPKTCNQCHLSGVDLSLFVRDDMCETRACLVELGLVDVKHPDQSEVLSWISRAEPDSTLITQTVIDQEYDAFREFVEQIAKCGGEACPGVHCPATAGDQGCGSPPQQPYGATSVPAGSSCDPISVETAFRDDVYVWRDRCFPCHFTSETGTDLGAPLFIDNQNSCNAGSLQTFHNLVVGGLLDADDPTQSLLLRKPLSAADGGVTHGGGAKFDGMNDPSYVSFLSFIEYWVSCGAPTP